MSNFSISSKNKVIRGPKRASYDVDTVYKIIDDHFLCHIGYVYQKEVIVIPTAYGRVEDKIYIHGSLKNRMLLSLLEAKNANLTITHLDGLVLARSAFHHSANYRSATIFGKVKRIDDPALKMKALKCILNHMINGHWDNIRKPNDRELKATLVIEITIETASAKIRAEGPNDEPQDYNLPIWAGVIPIKQVALPALSDNLINKNIGIPEEVNRYINNNR